MAATFIVKAPGANVPPLSLTTVLMTVSDDALSSLVMVQLLGFAWSQCD